MTEGAGTDAYAEPDRRTPSKAPIRAPGKATTRAPGKGALAERLELELLNGHPPAGAKLDSERALAERFGVSRPMVREALRGLEERGLVEVLPGRGAFVRHVRLTDAVRPLDRLYRQLAPTPRELIRARTMLERETAGLAAESATPADLAEIDEILGCYDLARDVLARARADIAFHTAVARAAHNPVIETMFGSITTLAFELMLRSLGDPNVSGSGVPTHRDISAAIRTGDAEAARAAMVDHVGVAARTYGDDLDHGLDLVAPRTIEQLLRPS